MTEAESEVLRRIVKDVVHEALPETLGEELSPMLARTVRQENARRDRNASWLNRLGYALLAVACGFLFIHIGDQADDNTRANNRQDCFLAGLVRQSLEQPEQHLSARQKKLGRRIVRQLEDGRGCNRPSPLKRPPPLLPH